ncbi:MAG: hypothetical protein RI900_3495 [Actinomycetota bacterium]|jgi:uncharacterized protein
MKHRSLITLTAALAAVGTLAIPETQAVGETLTVVGTYDTGLGANGSEIISIRSKSGVAAITNVAGSIDVLDVRNPAAITQLRRIDVSAYGTPNSVSIHPSKDYLLVAHGTAGSVGKVSAWRISDGAFLAAADAGVQPDSIKISPDGDHAVVANEAEGFAVGNDGGAGSLTVVDLKRFDPRRPRALTVAQVALPSAAGVTGFTSARKDDLARLDITNEPGTLEPESVTFDRNSRYAFVTLQENNGVVRLSLRSKTVTYFGLGATTHLADLTVGGGYLPTQEYTSLREPDGVFVFGRNGRYVVTADEGDTRNAAGSSGPRGGRTVSVLDTVTGTVVDTGNALDDIANSIGAYPDSRSNRGGVEPEGLAGIVTEDRVLVAVGLERGNAVVLLDVTDPTAAPVVLGIVPTGVGPEGVEFLRRHDELFLLSANEVAGTVTAVRIDL